jgi:hypothetical protein
MIKIIQNFHILMFNRLFKGCTFVSRMKKITAILLLTVYSLTTLGVGIRQFYCCGKLKSTNITLIQEAKEKCSNSNAMKGCCKTTFKSFKLKASHIFSSGTAVDFTKYFTELDIPATAPAINVSINETLAVTNARHAPPGKNIPLYIFYCTYLI